MKRRVLYKADNSNPIKDDRMQFSLSDHRRCSIPLDDLRRTITRDVDTMEGARLRFSSQEDMNSIGMLSMKKSTNFLSWGYSVSTMLNFTGNGVLVLLSNL
jgi:hypothetical protein